MENYYKYLPVSKEDELWGLHILNAGYTHIAKGTSYPAKDHPTPYYFNSESGRILQEYQLIYIASGEGSFESAAGKKNIIAGDTILLFPGDKHTYSPNTQTGWEEYWVGFNGGIINKQVKNGFFSPEEPIFHIGKEREFLTLFCDVIEKTKEEKPAYQQLMAGAVLQILGCIYARRKQSYYPEADETSQIINKAIGLFRENVTKQISSEVVAVQLGVGYSRFRKAFKNYTGIAPGQYLIQLRIEKAKHLLIASPKSIKEIAYELSFESEFYFSKLFKLKSGLSPQQFKNQYRNG